MIGFLLLSIFTYSQNSRINPHEFDQSIKRGFDKTLSNDTTYDVNFYHLDLEIEIDSAYLCGNVNYLCTAQIDGLNSLKLDLDSAFAIDSISFPAESYSFLDNELTINLSTSFNSGDTFSFTVYYHGVPELTGGIKGLRYEIHDENEPIIASLATPFLAHAWWPCKDGPGDKADSTFIYITIKDTIVNSIPVIAVSNGLLDNVETIGDKKTFKWKHFYPIVPYYVMVAISNYQHFQQIFNGSDYSFPIDYYVFESHLAEAQNGVAQMPDAIEFFTDIFGPYPFLQEKYGMTQLGFYGAIENQTNTITNNMGTNWFYISVHELAHQWFADMITCETWNHGWLNEGFASYAEALYEEHANGFYSYQNYMNSFKYRDFGTLYLYDVSDPFNVFRDIIYEKGAYVLHMLRGVLGDEVFFDAIMQYASDNSFMYKHATTEDFMFICENVSGLNLQYFFDQWIYDEKYPKYRYNYEYDEQTENLEIAILQIQEDVGWREIFIMPMQIKVDFVDGSDTIVNVFNDSKYQTFNFNLDKDVSDIELDPDDWILKTARFEEDVNVGISEFKQKDISVYPNPNNGAFRISFPDAYFDSDILLSVLDLSGKVVYEISDVGQKYNYEIILEECKTGIYFLRLRVGSKFYNQKIFINKSR